MVKVHYIREGKTAEVKRAVAEVLVKLGRVRILDDAAPAAIPTPVVPEPVVTSAIDLTPPAPVEVPAPVEIPVSAPVAFEPEPILAAAPVYSTKDEAPEAAEDTSGEPRKKRKYTRRDMSAEG